MYVSTGEVSWLGRSESLGLPFAKSRSIGFLISFQGPFVEGLGSSIDGNNSLWRSTEDLNQGCFSTSHLTVTAFDPVWF